MMKSLAARMTPRRWARLRRLVQAVALVAFAAFFLAARRGGWLPEAASLPMRLDPLAVLAHLLSSRALLAGSALALLLVGLTLAFGRAWCGWLCPLGTLLDLFPFRRARDGRAEPPDAWRGAKYALLVALLAAAALGSLALMALDPLTIAYRALAAGLWPALDRLFSLLEAALASVPALRPAVLALDGAVRPAVFPVEPASYRDGLLFLALLAGVIALNAIAHRFWCRYLCPLGGLLGLLSKAGLVRREVVNSQCTGCDACARVCPTGTIQFHKNGASDPSECTLCLDCLKACPRGGVTFAARLSPAPWSRYDPSRRQVLASAAVAAVGVGALRSEQAVRRDSPRLIQPPGGRENDLLSKCIRCGLCWQACPTHAIQPAIDEAGLAGVWTPVLLPRAGYCDYSCNACGQACPVQAIPPLSLEDKRRQVIGSAYIDTARCLAWADHTPCIVCEEMCPLPSKAITLVESRAQDPDGTTRAIQLPQVNRALCIGCGICEYKCPVNGQSAIRVHAPSA
jgi:polyferredoxin